MAGLFGQKQPQPDPALVQQQQTAQAQQAQAVQSGLSADTLNIFRQFATANAMYGAKLVSAPMTTTTGGFTNPASPGAVGASR